MMSSKTKVTNNLMCGLDMLHLNQLIAKATGTQRSNAEIIAHAINVVPREYNIP
jgi:hypothetical protein